MEKTYTASRCLALLKSYGISPWELKDLENRSVKVAEARGSAVIGFRHFIIAQGIPWGQPAADPADEAG